MNTSQGPGDTHGSWNTGGQWEKVDDYANQQAVDGGDGTATVELDAKDMATVTKMALRTKSARSKNPTTGAELGAGPGSGSHSH